MEQLDRWYLLTHTTPTHILPCIYYTIKYSGITQGWPSRKCRRKMFSVIITRLFSFRYIAVVLYAFYEQFHAPRVSRNIRLIRNSGTYKFVIFKRYTFLATCGRASHRIAARGQYIVYNSKRKKFTPIRC